MPDGTTRFKAKGQDIYHFVRKNTNLNLLNTHILDIYRWVPRRSRSTPSSPNSLSSRSMKKLHSRKSACLDVVSLLLGVP